jgi:hypothetical protein
MSHLRPNYPKGHELAGKTKALRDYSDDEKTSALTQTTDAALQRIAQNKPIDKGTANLMVDLAKGTEKEDTLPTEVTDAATAPDKAKTK